MESLFYLTTPLNHIALDIMGLFDIKHIYMVFVTYFFRGNLLLPHRLLFPMSSKGSFICTFPHTTYSLLCTSCGPLVGMENNPNCKCIRHAGGSKPLQLSALSPELRPPPRQVKTSLMVDCVMQLDSCCVRVKGMLTGLSFVGVLRPGDKRDPPVYIYI